MKKLVSWIVLIAMLGVLPLGSWFYLKQGLDYRKAALEELRSKQTIEGNNFMSLAMQGKTTLWVLDSSKAQKALIPIKEQFKDAYTFQIAGSWVENDVIYIPSHVKDSIITNREYVYALVDTSMHIRNFYTANDQQLKTMVEHLAIILPNAKDKDIKMK